MAPPAHKFHSSAEPYAPECAGYESAQVPYQDVVKVQVWAVDLKHRDSNQPGESTGRCPHEFGSQCSSAAKHQPRQQQSRNRILQTEPQAKQASQNEGGLL